MKYAFQFKINYTGGIVSPGHLAGVLHALQEAGITHVRFGLRQQLLIDASYKEYKKVAAALREIDVVYEMNEDVYPNISSSYPAASIFIKDSWLSEGVYKDVFNALDNQHRLKINIVDSNQTFTPFFTSHLNWIAAAPVHFWYLCIRFPGTNIIFQWKELIYTNDIGRLSAILEKEIINDQNSLADASTANELYNRVVSSHSFNTKTISSPLVLPAFKLPYYEGYNEHDNKSWLGIYRRDERFGVDFLKDVCRICLETKSGELYTTPWKSIIIKGIAEKHRPLWGFVLGKYRINVRHAYNELNWQVEDGNNEGLQIKKQIIRQFDKEDIRSYGLCFAVKTQPKSGVFGSVLIRRQFTQVRKKLTALDRYDILYTADFNPNSKEYILFRKDVDKMHLATYLVAICKYYYEQEDLRDLLPGSIPTKASSTALITESVKTSYQCVHCLTVYDEQYGEPENNIPANTAFRDLPSSYCCPVCEADKAAFILIENMPTLQSVKG